MDTTKDHLESILARPIGDLRLEEKTLVLLKNARILTVGDVVRTEREKGLLRVRNIGRTHYESIQHALAEMGITPDGTIIEEYEEPQAEQDQAAAASQSQRETSALKTVAFVDYEHWYVALKEIHQRRPNIQTWFDDLKTRGQLLEVTFFGNFSDTGGMRDELEKIRCFTNRIIETKNAGLYSKKSFTDFIMLDNIYQKVIASPEIDQIVLFTGDGDFCSVASYLRNFCGKTIGIYGVEDALSGQLEEISNWCVRVPFLSEPRWECRVAILKNIKYAADHSRSPTFRATVRLVSDYYGLPEDAVTAELRLLLDEGIVYTMPERSRRDYTIMLNILHINWSMIDDPELKSIL